MLEVDSETHRSSGIFSELNDSRNGFTLVKFISNKFIAILSAFLKLLQMDGWKDGHSYFKRHLQMD
jgi:hypothetical protein